MDEARQPKSPKLKGELTDLKRHRISELAKAFFFDRGYSATSFDILAAELGVTKPLIYGVYRSKAELLKELCLRPVIEARDVVEFARTMTGPPTQKIRRLLFDLSMLMCHRRMETTIFFAEQKSLGYREKVEMASLRHETHNAMVAIIAEGIRFGDFDVPDAETAALALTGMVTWIHIWFRPDGRLTPDAIAKSFADLGALLLARSKEPKAEKKVLTDWKVEGTRSSVQATISDVESPRRRSILKHAADLFFLRGYEQSTLDALAREVGITKPMIYDYFDSKRQILAEIGLRVAEHALSLIQDTSQIRGARVQILAATIDRFLEMYLKQQSAVTIVRRERRHLPLAVVQRMRELNSSFDQILRDILTDGVNHGEFEIEDVGMAVLAITGIVCWSSSWYRNRGIEHERVVRETITHLALKMAQPGEL